MYLNSIFPKFNEICSIGITSAPAEPLVWKLLTSTGERITVKNSCCSGAQIQELLEEFQGRRAAVLALFKAAEVLVDRIRRTSSYKKLVEEWKAVPAKQDTGVGDVADFESQHFGDFAAQRAF